MELLQSLSGGLVAAAAVFIVAWLGKERYDARFEALHGEIRELKEDFRQMRTEMATMRTEMATMRSDITNVALAVGARPRPQTG